MKTKRAVILAMGAVLVIAAILFVVRKQEGANPGTAATVPAATADYYTCPMHPSVHSDHPGACPICGMTLVKRSSEMDTSMNMSDDLGTVTVSPSRQVLANVAVTAARRMAVTHEIRAVGTLTTAEPNVRRISARFPGRLDRLYLSYTGQHVRKGDPVADVYSPEAISAQEEFLLALQASADSVGAGDLPERSREKLLRWGFTDSQISTLQRANTVRDAVTIYSPISGVVTDKKVDPQQYVAAGEELYEVADLSTVWLNADIYEYEVSDLKPGETVEAGSDAYPGKTFRGTITFISPMVDPAARTVRVRAELANPSGELKADMYVDVVIRVRLPESVAVPTSAVLSTGTRRVVWVQKAEGIFEPRRVVVGEKGGDYCQILQGLSVGEEVVTSGGYLLDSESQLELPATSRMDHAMQ